MNHSILASTLLALALNACGKSPPPVPATPVTSDTNAKSGSQTDNAPEEPITCHDVFAQGFMSTLGGDVKEFFYGLCQHRSQTMRACMIATKTSDDLNNCEKKAEEAGEGH